MSTINEGTDGGDPLADTLEKLRTVDSKGPAEPGTFTIDLQRALWVALPEQFKREAKDGKAQLKVPVRPKDVVPAFLFKKKESLRGEAQRLFAHCLDLGLQPELEQESEIMAYRAQRHLAHLSR